MFMTVSSVSNPYLSQIPFTSYHICHLQSFLIYVSAEVRRELESFKSTDERRDIWSCHVWPWNIRYKCFSYGSNPQS